MGRRIAWNSRLDSTSPVVLSVTPTVTLNTLRDITDRITCYRHPWNKGIRPFRTPRS